MAAKGYDRGGNNGGNGHRGCGNDDGGHGGSNGCGYGRSGGSWGLGQPSPGGLALHSRQRAPCVRLSLGGTLISLNPRCKADAYKFYALFTRFTCSLIAVYSWNGYGNFRGTSIFDDWDVVLAWRKWLISPSFSGALTSSTHQNADQTNDKTYRHMGSWSPSSNHLQYRL